MSRPLAASTTSAVWRRNSLIRVVPAASVELMNKRPFVR
jgi:hypothetical protein